MKNQAEEDLLVMAAQKGNHRAFSELFQRHQQGLLRFAYKLSNDLEVAKDASQDVWIKSAKTLHKLDDPRAFKSWMYRSVRWRTIDLVRQKQALDKKFSNNLDEQNLVVDNSSQDSVDTKKSALSQAIDKLPALEKQIIYLFYLDDMTVPEVAVIIEIPIGTVKSRLNRARQMLKQKLESTEHEY